MDGADRKAWFDAEHVENQERALDGDTAALKAKIAELTAELDSARRDRETYREQLSEILGLLDEMRYVTVKDEWLLRDEGMA